MKKIPLLFAAVLGFGIVGCSEQQAPSSSVRFSSDISPILKSYCVECHQPGGPGLAASGLSFESYDNLMKGTKFGPVIVPGSSLSSTLVRLIEGRADKSLKMPHGDRKPLDPESIKLIKDWIDQGAKKN